MQFPSYLLVKTFDWNSARVVISSRSRNLKEISTDLPGQQYRPRMRVDVRPWDYMKAAAFMEWLQMDSSIVEYTDPEWPVGTNKTVNGARSAGQQTVAFTSITGVEVGHLVNFSSHTKLYRIVSISGNTVTLNTPLQESVAGGSVANMANPVISMRLATDQRRDMTLTSTLRRNLSRLNLRFEEVIS